MNFEQAKNTKAIVTTVSIHALLLLIAAYFVITVPAQAAVEELGMEVNLGTTEDGFGDDQAEDPNDPAALDLADANQAKLAEDISEDIANIHTDDHADAERVVVNKPKEVNPNTKKTITPNTPTTPVKNNNKNQNNNTNTAKATVNTAAQPKYRFEGGAGQGGNQAAGQREGGNQGIGNGDGDMGVPGGTPGADNYKGKPGRGNSLLDFNLENRHIVSKPSTSASFTKGGTVKVSVKVNKQGVITSWNFVSGGTDELRAIVSQKIKDVKFNSSSTAPIEQIGTINFNFKAGK